jgi:hypothetical protein
MRSKLARRWGVNTTLSIINSHHMQSAAGTRTACQRGAGQTWTRPSCNASCCCGTQMRSTSTARPPHVAVGQAGPVEPTGTPLHSAVDQPGRQDQHQPTHHRMLLWARQDNHLRHQRSRRTMRVELAASRVAGDSTHGCTHTRICTKLIIACHSTALNMVLQGSPDHQINHAAAVGIDAVSSKQAFSHAMQSKTANHQQLAHAKGQRPRDTQQHHKANTNADLDFVEEVQGTVLPCLPTNDCSTILCVSQRCVHKSC